MLTAAVMLRTDISTSVSAVNRIRGRLGKRLRERYFERQKAIREAEGKTAEDATATTGEASAAQEAGVDKKGEAKLKQIIDDELDQIGFSP